MLCSNWLKHSSFIYCFAHPSKIWKNNKKFNSLSPDIYYRAYTSSFQLDYAWTYPERQSTSVIAFARPCSHGHCWWSFQGRQLTSDLQPFGLRSYVISSFSRLSSLMPGFFNRTAFANAQNGPIIMCRVVSRRPMNWLTSNARWIIPRLFLK